MEMKTVVVSALALAVSACGGGAADDAADPSTTASSTTIEAAETTTTTEPPPPTLTLAIDGEEEIVFDHSSDACEAEHIPDLAARAFRDAGGRVQLIVSHYTNYRMVGPELDQLTSDCTPILRSAYDADPAQFDDSEWLAATYTEDGQTIHAIVHNEYRGHTHSSDRCPSGDYFTCLDTSLTMAISDDGGDSYRDLVPAPGHLAATLPYPHDPDGGPTGLRTPSNILRAQDGFFYVFSNVSSYPSQRQWVCLMRTDDLTDPGSWRYWDGEGFAGEFVDPYRDDVGRPADHTCAPLAQDQIGASLNESVTFHEPSGLYVLVGISADQRDGRETWGFYYATSPDLIEWTRRELLLETPLPWTVGNSGTDVSTLYPVLLDPASDSRNFDTIGDRPYLYFTRMNAGQGSLDRDLVRVPVTVDLGS